MVLRVSRRSRSVLSSRLMACALLAAASLGTLLAKPASAQSSGSWWAHIEKEGTNDVSFNNGEATGFGEPPFYQEGFGVWGSNSGDAEGPETRHPMYEYNGSYFEGFGSLDAWLPVGLSQKWTSFVSVAHENIGATGWPSPGKLKLILEWCASDGSPASSPPSSVTIDLTSTAWAIYSNSQPYGFSHTEETSAADFVTDTSPHPSDIYTYLDNGFGDTVTPTVTASTSDWQLDVTQTGTHRLTLTVATDPITGYATATREVDMQAQAYIQVPDSSHYTSLHQAATCDINAVLVP